MNAVHIVSISFLPSFLLRSSSGAYSILKTYGYTKKNREINLKIMKMKSGKNQLHQ